MSITVKKGDWVKYIEQGHNYMTVGKSYQVVDIDSDYWYCINNIGKKKVGKILYPDSLK